MATAEVTPTHQVAATNDVGGSGKSKGAGVGPAGQVSAPLKARRRLGIDEQGFTYKSTPSSTLMASLQLGLQHSIGRLEPQPRRDILMTDFEVVQTVDFPAEGSGVTPGHKYSNFTFKTYSPVAFRFFREAFGILAEDYLLALCDLPLRELVNPGASGSLFYLSADDAFIIKTVQKKEAKFLQKLLPGYYLNLTQNKKTLLPKFFGLYRYKSGSVNIRIVVMNNLLPSSVQYHEKYDLKGSTYKRRASPRELDKKSPTYKDLDFVERHEEGIALTPEKYDILFKTVERDCKVLESFGIMDYSLLMGVHNVDHQLREMAEAAISPVDTPANAAASPDMAENEVDGAFLKMDKPVRSRIELSKNFSIISVEDIPVAVQDEQTQTNTLLMHYPEGYIQGRIQGDRVLVYVGVIDILQSYRLKKKLEHTMKSLITDGNSVSVHNPSFYARRFQDFLNNQVFRREKVRFRTRKNSALVQSRGRKQQQGATAVPGSRVPAPILARIPERQSSKEFDSRDLVRGAMATSPTHTTQKALAGFSVGPRPDLRALPVPDSYRRRAMSETVATSRPSRVPEVPLMEVYRSKAQSDSSPHGRREEGGGRRGEKEEGERREEEEEGGRREEEEKGRRGEEEEEGGRRGEEEEGERREEVEEGGRRGEGDRSGDGGDQTQLGAGPVLPEETEGDTTEDFARNVRGASTPISEESPTMESKQQRETSSNQTFNDSSTSEVVMATDEQGSKVEEEGEVREEELSVSVEGT